MSNLTDWDRAYMARDTERRLDCESELDEVYQLIIDLGVSIVLVACVVIVVSVFWSMA